MSSLNKGQFYRHPVSVGRDGVGPYSGVGMGRLGSTIGFRDATSTMAVGGDTGIPASVINGVTAADLTQLANPWMPDANANDSLHLTWAPGQQGIMVSAANMPNLPITTQVSNWVSNNQTLAIIAGFGLVGLLLLAPRRGR